MGLFGKSKISEADAVGRVLTSTLEHTAKNWAALLRAYGGENPAKIFPGYPESFRKQGISMFFGITVLVAESRAIPNLFPADQAARLRSRTLALLQALEKHSGIDLHSTEYFDAVDRVWNEAIRRNTSLVDGLGEVLFDVCQLERTFEFGGERHRDPLTVKALGGICIDLAAGRWKDLASNFRVI